MTENDPERTPEQDANLRRHLRHQKHARTHEEGIAVGIAGALRFLLRLLIFAAGISMIVKANEWSSIDPALGMFVIPLFFIGICFVIFSLLGTWGLLALLHLTFRN